MMQSASAIEFYCPKDECRKILPEYDLLQLLTKEKFSLYQKMAVNRALDGVGDIFRCLTPDCEFAIVLD